METMAVPQERYTLIAITGNVFNNALSPSLKQPVDGAYFGETNKVKGLSKIEGKSFYPISSNLNQPFFYR